MAAASFIARNLLRVPVHSMPLIGCRGKVLSGKLTIGRGSAQIVVAFVTSAVHELPMKAKSASWIFSILLGLSFGRIGLSEEVPSSSSHWIDVPTTVGLLLTDPRYQDLIQSLRGSRPNLRVTSVSVDEAPGRHGLTVVRVYLKQVESGFDVDVGHIVGVLRSISQAPFYSLDRVEQALDESHPPTSKLIQIDEVDLQAFLDPFGLTVVGHEWSGNSLVVAVVDMRGPGTHFRSGAPAMYSVGELSCPLIIERRGSRG